VVNYIELCHYETTGEIILRMVHICQSYYQTPRRVQGESKYPNTKIIVVGRVPGDYPVPAGYYVKMWPDPSNLSNSIT